MRSYRTEQVSVDRKILESITCNVCGRVFWNGPNGIEAKNDMEFCTFAFTGGYYSKIGDGIRIFFDVCEDCMIKFLDSFRVPFEAVDIFGEDAKVVSHGYIHDKVRKLARNLRAKESP